MQEFIIPVNNEAHARALVAVVGEDNAQLVLKAYQAIDAAMNFGYERGLAEARKNFQELTTEEASTHFEAGQIKGFEEGYKAADAATLVNANEAFMEGFNEAHQYSYDDGYTDGVSDARVWPAFADENVERLCDMDDYDDARDVYEIYEGDSGDENDAFYDPRKSGEIEAFGYELKDTF